MYVLLGWEQSIFLAYRVVQVLGSTSNNYLSVVRRMLGLAVEWNVISHIPAVKWLKCPPPEFDFLAFSEAERLVAAADDEWRPMIFTALKIGMRLGELLALRWEDVDLVAGRLMVRRAVARGIMGTPKNRRTREVPLSEDLLRTLKGISEASWCSAPPTARCTTSPEPSGRSGERASGQGCASSGGTVCGTRSPRIW
jgi:integrase